MKRFLILALLIFGLTTLSLSAQAEDDDGITLAGEDIHHIIGFSYSTVSGAGLTYQYAIDPYYRLKTSGFLFWDENTESEQEDILSYNIGAEFQRTLHRTKVTRLYALTGGQYYYNRTRGGYTMFGSLVGDKSANEIELKTIAFGVGMGLEIFAWKNISLNADGNYYFEQTDKTSIRPTSPSDPTLITREDRARRVRFGFGIGIGYAF
jgi:opacity protein-like surface antigen